MADAVQCPVCHQRMCTMFVTGAESEGFDCFICGRFSVTRSALASKLDFERNLLSPMQRAVLSYRIRTAVQDGARPVVSTDTVNQVDIDARLPTPATQAANFIRVIGDHVAAGGEPYQHDEATHARIGAFNERAVHYLIKQLEAKKLIFSPGGGSRPGFGGGLVHGPHYEPTLDGWARYEAERSGKFAGRYGFIAMKFNDPILEQFVSGVVKPSVLEGIGYDLIDVREVSQAGVIDNIMRAAIRDAAFVLVDLTHDNSGAYWEAGYAEGLGKPVIYLCERAKFADKPSHFDTNHCTTVMWSVDGSDIFRAELVATLRRSLNLFPA